MLSWLCYGQNIGQYEHAHLKLCQLLLIMAIAQPYKERRACRVKSYKLLGAIFLGRPPKSQIFRPSPCPGVSEFSK